MRGKLWGQASSGNASSGLWGRSGQNAAGTIDLLSSSDDGFIEGASVSANLADPDGILRASFQWQTKTSNGVWTDIAGARGRTLTLESDDAGSEFRVVASYLDRKLQPSTAIREFTALDAPTSAPSPSPETPPPNVPDAPPVALPQEGSVTTPELEPATPPVAGPVTTPEPDPAPPQASPEPSPAPTPAPIPASNTHATVSLESSTGSFTDGATLTANIIDPNGFVDVTYHWQVKGADGTWKNIQGENERTYTLDADDAGKDMAVYAMFTDDLGNSETAWQGYTVENGLAATLTPAPAPTSPAPVTQPEPTPSSPIASPAPALPEPEPAPTSPTPPAASPAPTPTPPPASVGAVPNGGADDFMLGVNIAGGAFGSGPGVHGVNYIYPTHAELDYYAAKGMEVIRLPFLWERIQPNLNGPLSASELALIDDIVNYSESKGMAVLLDVHNYGKFNGSLVGSAAVPDSSFADLWSKLGSHFADSSNVMFGLMNEPNLQSATQWIGSVNAAIDAIRDAGAMQQVLVPGTYWDSAMSWVSSDNDTAVGGGVIDPANNYAFEVHQYMDHDATGTNAGVVSSTIGVQRITDVTNWAKATGNKLFLGEFGVARDQQSLAALDLMLDYMQSNNDVWEGASYWAGGAWWGDYMFSVEPANGVDKPQMTVLGQHVA